MHTELLKRRLYAIHCWAISQITMCISLATVLVFLGEVAQESKLPTFLRTPKRSKNSLSLCWTRSQHHFTSIRNLHPVPERWPHTEGRHAASQPESGAQLFDVFHLALDQLCLGCFDVFDVHPGTCGYQGLHFIVQIYLNLLTINTDG